MNIKSLTDFSEYEVDARRYRGSENKRSICMNGKYYMVKLPDDTIAGGNVISEYIGCHILQACGFEVQNTVLGRWGERLVVACEDFCPDGWELHEFSWYLQMVYPSNVIGKQITYKQLYKTFNECKFLQPIRDAAVKAYWDIIASDALIGNCDRHKDNFGYLVNRETGEIKPSPVYDCGSSLYSRLSENEYELVLGNEEDIQKRMYVFPKMALLDENNNKLGYREFLSSNADKNATTSFLDVYSRIKMDKIFADIDNVPVITDNRKHFCKEMLKHRKAYILDEIYSTLKAKGCL